jgi:beta-glucosidase
MKKLQRLALAALLGGVTALPSSAAIAQQVSAKLNSTPSGTIAARVESLLRAMTLDEKLGFVHGYFPPRAKPSTPEHIIASAGHVPGILRLGIPVLRESDASLGVANQIEQRRGDTATALPSGLATAASFDPSIAYAGGEMIGAEARAKTFNILLAGGVNLTRDPWGGRNFEYMGEDPLLAGIMAGSTIRGVQSNHIVSTIKHFALNAQETGRMVLDARLAPAALRESDLLAFEIALEHGQPGSVMCAYNRVDGDYACENDMLLNQVLKRDWGYHGWVMSDWGAVHSTVKAANAGLDQESGQELDKAIYFGAPLAAAVSAGTVAAARLDDMVRRILYGIVASGLMDDPVPAAPVTIDYAAHALVAQRAAEAGIVLLKNDPVYSGGKLLPLSKTVRKIVLIGGHADVGVLSGGGSSQVRSVGGVPVEISLTRGDAASFARVTWHASSPLNAIRAAAPGAEVSYVDGGDVGAAAAAARAADIAIVFATQWQSEAQDVHDLALPDNQDAIIAAAAAANPHTLVVLETGGPVLMPWLADVPAVLEAWYPGQRGGTAIARIVFGEVNPGGRLPMTFPAHAEQAPRPVPPGLAALDRLEAASPKVVAPQLPPFAVDYREGADAGYRWYERQRETPLFAFGYGLSYASFRYSELTVAGGPAPTVDFDVTNDGDRAGTDVPQAYVAATGSGGTTTHRLAGWQRLFLKPGETRHVSLPIDPRIIARFDAMTNSWQRAPSSYRFSIGQSATNYVLSQSVELPRWSARP